MLAKRRLGTINFFFDLKNILGFEPSKLCAFDVFCDCEFVFYDTTAFEFQRKNSFGGGV